MTKYFCARY